MLLKTDKEDTVKVNHLNNLCWSYRKIREFDKGLECGEKALELSKKLGFKKGMATAYNNTGTVYWNIGDFKTALKYDLLTIEIGREMNDLKIQAAAYNNIGMLNDEEGNRTGALKNYFIALRINDSMGNKVWKGNNLNNIAKIYCYEGNYSEALKHSYSALKVREEIGDKSGIGSSLVRLGNIYNLQANTPEALKNYFAALRIYEDLGDKKNIADLYNNIGTLHDEDNNYKEGLKYYALALKMSKDLGDKHSMAYTLSNIGNIYVNQGNDEEGLKYYSELLKIGRELESTFDIASAYVNLGAVHTHLKHIAEAKKYLDMALRLNKEIGNRVGVKYTYGRLAILDSTIGDYKSQIKNYKLYIIYNDSLINEETKKKAIEQSMTYTFEKKELQTKAEQDKKDVLAAEEKQKQRIITYSISAGLLLVLLLAIFIFRGLRQKQKANLIITKQKLEVESQKHMIEEKHKEITDSINYAERIQRSFIATKEILDEYLKEYFVLFKPKDIVSGDFYWAEKLNNANFALVTADSTGHGVPGAIMSLLNITSLEKAIESTSEPSEILNSTRKTIIKRLKKDGSTEGGKDGMDCSLLSFDFKNKKLIVAAANNPVWIVRGTETIDVKPDKMPVGKHDRDAVSFTQQEIDLQKGDVIYTLTDGFPDQFGGEKGKKFMSKNLRELLASNVHLPMLEQKLLLERTFKDWVDDLEQVDDVTVIGIRIS
jgi:serine phosphatase RsbU (regulator of sigma subunit)